MRTVLLLIAATAAAAVAYAGTTAAAPGSWRTERYLTTETWHAFADVGPQDDGGPGDIYAAQQRVTSLSGRPIGIVNGYGINLHPPFVFFHWTASLPGGSLTLESAIDLHADKAVYPIEGGTRRYAGARGTVTVRDRGSSGSLVTVRYHP
jgi:hypothetical protein